MKIRKAFIPVFVFIAVVNIDSKAQKVDSVRSYIDTALTIMQTRSLYANHLNWKKIRDSVEAKAANATTYNEAFPALAYAFRHLKDYHGMFANRDTMFRYPPPVDFDKVLSDGIKKEFLKGNKIVTAIIGTVGYLRIPGINGTSQASMDQKGNQLRDSLASVLEKKPLGLIIDLRMNTGGNSAPMISGIGPLFQSSVLGYGIDRDGKLLDPVVLKDGIITDGKGNKTVNIKNRIDVDPSMPIAVLIGPSTVSSGEILAAFLKQQKNVKVFGEDTPGFCNATQGFPFKNNTGYLSLVVNKIADAKKKVYEDLKVHPDVYIKSRDNYEQLDTDPTIIAAQQWLDNKTARKKRSGSSFAIAINRP